MNSPENCASFNSMWTLWIWTILYNQLFLWSWNLWKSWKYYYKIDLL